MRPTGIVLIAIYHFLGCRCSWCCLPIALAIGGSVLGAMFAAGTQHPAGRHGYRAFVGDGRSCLHLAFPLSPPRRLRNLELARVGTHSVHRAGRHLAAVFSSRIAVHGPPFRLVPRRLSPDRIAISVVIIWYLVQPQIRALFQRCRSFRVSDRRCTTSSVGSLP